MSKGVILTIVTLVLVVALSAAGVSCGNSKPVQFLTYADEANGFSIDYPKGWDVNPKESSDVKVAIWSKKFGIDAAGILIAKYDAPGYTLKTFSDLQIGALPTMVKDYTSISTEELTVSGIPAIKHTYRHTVTPTAYKTVKVYLLQDGTGWILNFPCPQKSFDSYHYIFENALNSFRLLK